MKWIHDLDVDISDLKKLKNFCSSFSVKLNSREICLLNGPMAAGKSELVKQMVSVLLGEEVTSSPSYALHHEYVSSQKKSMLPISHWDLYRLQGEDDLESTGFWDQLRNASGPIFIEWAEKLNSDWLPRDRKYYLFEIKFEKGARTLSVSHSS